MVWYIQETNDCKRKETGCRQLSFLSLHYSYSYIYRAFAGRLAEWSNAHDWNSCVLSQGPRVRIPDLPNLVTHQQWSYHDNHIVTVSSYILAHTVVVLYSCHFSSHWTLDRSSNVAILHKYCLGTFVLLILLYSYATYSYLILAHDLNYCNITSQRN